ncbi:MAG: radical SAM protein, partial [Bacteroidetes bacterium]|nr:radical SAM protein [Bacteroidota bacterium]
LRPGIPELVARLVAIPGIDTLAITSNGTRLAAQATALRKAGLDAVNISLDTLRADRFRAITRRDDHDAVLKGIAAALHEGFKTVKLNMVVMRGINDDEIEDFIALTRDAPLQVRFIEYMPFDANGWDADRLLPGAELRARVAEKYILHAIGDSRGAVASSYAVEGHRGTLGFISSMTEHFCDGCDRLRLTADGALKICLFSEGEVNLRDLLRAGATDEDVMAAVRTALAGKWRAHPGAKELVQLHNRSMIRIGG